METAGGGGGAADGPAVSAGTEEGAPVGGSDSPADLGANQPRLDSRGKRRRSVDMDGRIPRLAKEDGRIPRLAKEDGGIPRSSAEESRKRSDHPQSGPSSERPHAVAEHSRTEPDESPSAEPSAPIVIKSETAADSAPPETEMEDGEDQLTHLELETVYRDTLSGLLASDPLLSDLPASLTGAELRSLTALEHGTAMAVLVNRGDRLTRVIVQRSATVRDLKVALRSAVELEVARRGGRRRAISWRYVWRANWLAFGGKRLKDDSATLQELGIGNKAEVGFVKRIRPKRGQREKKGGQV